MKPRARMLSLCLAIACAGAFAALWAHRSHAKSEDKDDSPQWEYLVVAGGFSNLSTAGNDAYPAMRKQTDASFAREFFPLERNLDKLGAKGWELVAIQGVTNEPIFYFKRPKKGR